MLPITQHAAQKPLRPQQQRLGCRQLEPLAPPPESESESHTVEQWYGIAKHG